jgi:hypothetical protein
MVSYLAEKYAYLLTKEDARQLFQSLATLSGSVSEAARMCDIRSRKTIYDWKETTDLKISTRTKILDASLRNIPDNTLSFLLDKSEQGTSDILHIILSRIFETAMKHNLNKEVFTELANGFTLITKEHAGIVLERLEEEVGEMAQSIHKKAFDLKVNLPPVAIETMKHAQLLELLLTIVKSLPEKVTPEEKLDWAMRFNIPVELVDVSAALTSIVHARYEVELRGATPQALYPVPTAPMELQYRSSAFKQEPVYTFGRDLLGGEVA